MTEIDMPLTNAQREHVARRLQNERARVDDARNQSVRDHARENAQDRAGDRTEMPFRPADLGTATKPEKLDAAIAPRPSCELAEIDAALDRRYRTRERLGGWEDRGRGIPVARRELMPRARACAVAGS
jgi:RNA polymerase-binding transcription factor DksA